MVQAMRYDIRISNILEKKIIINLLKIYLLILQRGLWIKLKLYIFQS